MKTGALDRLGGLVRQRRDALNLSQRVAANNADVSDETWLKIENGRKVSDRSLAKAERALGWRPGTIDHILAGGDPPDSPSVDPWPRTGMTQDEKLNYLESLIAGVREGRL